MKPDIKINKKQLKFLAIEMLIKNVKSNYDMRNRFDAYVAREIAGTLAKDSYEVITNPIKYIKQMENSLNNCNALEMAELYYDELYEIKSWRMRKTRGFALDRKLLEIDIAFNKCYPVKMERLKRGEKNDLR